MFVTALEGKVQEFRDALSSFALRVRADSLLTDPDFEMSGAMRDDVRRHLADQGLVVSDDVWTDALPYVDREASYRVLRYVFGSEAELKRRTADDEVVAAGVRVLRDISTTAELLEASR